MTFKEFLNEYMDASDDMSAADFARMKRQKEQNPKAAAMKLAKKQDMERKMAQQDDTMSPDEKDAERLEAMAARKRARVAQKQKPGGMATATGI